MNGRDPLPWYDFVDALDIQNSERGARNNQRRTLIAQRRYCIARAHTARLHGHDADEARERRLVRLAEALLERDYGTATTRALRGTWDRYNIWLTDQPALDHCVECSRPSGAWAAA